MTTNPLARRTRHVAVSTAVTLIAGATAFTGLARAAALPANGPSDRRYELVSPADTQGGDVSGLVQFMPGPGPARPDGQAVTFGAKSPLEVGSTGVPPGQDILVARRSSTGWQSTYTGPSPTMVRRLTYSGSTPDLATQFYMLQGEGTNLDPRDTTGWGIYRRDADGSLTWVSQDTAGLVLPSFPTFNASTPDGRHVIFRDQIDAGGYTAYALFDRTDGRTEPVSVADDGAILDSPEFGGMTRDGSRIFFTAYDPATGEGALYLRAGGHVRSVSPTQTADPNQLPQFEAASPDGHLVIFSTAQQLLAGDTDTSRDLYRYDTDTEMMTLLSAGSATSGSSDACVAGYGASQCDVSPVATSPDGRDMYFLSPEQLDGAHGVVGEPNLYRRSIGEGIVLLATLTAQDTFDSIDGFLPDARPVRVSADGQHVVFESHARLDSAYDNAGHSEVYDYARADGSVTCVSCGPAPGPATADAQFRGGNQGELGHGRNVSSDGRRIYFETAERLVAEDTNEAIDVYESHDGVLSLISSGTSPQDSHYWDNGDDGADVFFFTAQTLVQQDRNGTSYKLYDARRGGGFPVLAPSSECAGEDCRPAPSAPPRLPVAASIVFATPVAIARPSTSGRAKVTVAAKSIKGSTATLRVKVPAKGRLVASGSRLRTVTRSLTRASTATLKLTLTTRAKRTLKRRHALKVTVRVRYVSAQGAASSTTVSLTLKA